MTLKRLLFVFAVFLIALVPVVSAQNASISNLGQLGDEDILIYTYDPANNSQMLYGQWNTSSPYVPLPADDFNIVVRPSAQARFANPQTFLSDFFSWAQTNALSLIIILFLIGLVWKR